jgi:hypothetical protein
LAALALGPAAVAAAAGAPVSPAALAASILASAEAQRSVHYVVVLQRGGTTLTQVGDVGRREGIQQITLLRHGERAELTVVVVPRGAYLRGGAFALQALAGLTAGQASSDAGIWLSLGPHDPDYASVAAAVTLRSFLSDLVLGPPFARSADVRVEGQQAVVLLGSSPGDAHLSGRLEARAAGSPLPLEETVAESDGRLTVSLGPWNERLELPHPAHAQPLGGTVLA